ncbi:protein MpRLK-Pelle_L-LEC25 [Marchantia polymorpha subsp. ruderalis]|uniref:non-specific serine/threonine protein kinase n=2 Tax=Marchantia polymorpha TaxID=3197 RepID=A0AAF6BLY5_MARPO|nr:hypothetical protein MARPO_0163s0009 [Marchantia polymorpha]BBN13019.1 hypothetical protein Mp_6g00110 [Marchantia polymorpha subsp. ruderalis]|eukprot:PTQ28448.1 hypothetical protein MARPO_0163s0009 [Marchantia polymorpha]
MTKVTAIWFLALAATLSFQERPTGNLVYADNFTIGTSAVPFSCSDGGDISCGGAVSINQLSGGIILLAPSSNRSQPGSWGTALTSKPIDLLDPQTKAWHSFSTFFQFMITSLRGDWAGDGMVFALLGDGGFRGVAGTGFGVYNESKQVVKTLAVEFDTFFTKADERVGDVDSNHVGVDTEVSQSKASKSASNLGMKLFGNQVFVWIDYDALTQILEVRINYLKFPKPAVSFLNTTINLTEVFGSSPIYAGFSTANGASNKSGIYHIAEWSFEHFPAVGSAGSQFNPGSRSLNGTGSSTNEVALIAGVTAGAFFLLLLAGLLVFCVWRRSDSRSRLRTGTGLTSSIAMGHNSLQYTYDQLRHATSQFSSKLGQGGFGSVYEGWLQPPRGGKPQHVAVKRMVETSTPGEFESEVLTVSEVRHKGIVKLLGWCSHEGVFLIVYELMPNGSLDKALFYADDGYVLPWESRMNILKGVAEALHYLHDSHDQKEQIIHRDIKTSNILLDADYNPKLGDFGLARVLDRTKNPAPMTVAGTPGFLAPEVSVDETFTTRSDVYAFGMVALEIVTGRQAMTHTESLKDIVWKKREEETLLSCVDFRLDNLGYDQRMAEKVLGLGLLCCLYDPHARPTMKEVVEILAGSKPLPDVPATQPHPNLDHHLKTIMTLDTTIQRLQDDAVMGHSSFRHSRTSTSSEPPAASNSSTSISTTSASSTIRSSASTSMSKPSG